MGLMGAALISGGLGLASSLFGGSSGGQKVSQTVNTDWRTPSQKKDAERIWNDYINSFYGISEEAPAGGTSLGSSVDLESLRGVSASMWPSDIAVAYSNHMKRLGYPDNPDNQAEFLQKYAVYLETGNLPSFQPAGGGFGISIPLPSDYNPFEDISTGTGGVTGDGGEPVKGYKERLEEDMAYLKEIEEQYNVDMGDMSGQFMEETRGAVSPYQDLLSRRMGEAETGTGMFKPVSFGFGGQQMVSFVPRQNRELASQTLGMGKEQMTMGTGLAELARDETKAILERGFQTGQKFTPNQVESLYAQKLEELAFKMNQMGVSSRTSSGTVPGPSTWSNILEGLNVGANIYRSQYPWQTRGQNIDYGPETYGR